MCSKPTIQDICNLVSSVIGAPVNYYTNIDNTLEWDSLEQIKILLALEKRFDCNFSSRDARTLRSIQAIADRLGATLQSDQPTSTPVDPAV